MSGIDPKPEAFARQFNFKVRTIVASASVYLVPAMVFASTEGIRDQIELPAVTKEDLSALSAADFAVTGLRWLPQTLDEALRLLGESEAVSCWFWDSLPTFISPIKVVKSSA